MKNDDPVVDAAADIRETCGMSSRDTALTKIQALQRAPRKIHMAVFVAVGPSACHTVLNTKELTDNKSADIDKYGEMKVPAVTQEKTLRGITCRMSFAFDKAIGEVNYLRGQDGNFTFDFWIPPPDVAGTWIAPRKSGVKGTRPLKTLQGPSTDVEQAHCEREKNVNGEEEMEVRWKQLGEWERLLWCSVEHLRSCGRAGSNYSRNRLDERWWSDSVQCYCYLRNVQDLLAGFIVSQNLLTSKGKIFSTRKRFWTQLVFA